LSVEDVLKIVSVVLIPSIGAVVWLLGQVYGLRSDLKALQQDIKRETDSSSFRLVQLEKTIEHLSRGVIELTLMLARAGIDDIGQTRQNKKE
jgi:hypothetical protein